MENSGLAFAATASPYVLDGLAAMKDTSNHFAAQRMDYTDTANIFATPVRNPVDDGARTNAQESFESNTVAIEKIQEEGQSEVTGMQGQAESETAHASAPIMGDPELSNQHVFSTLDTPARPTVDHGIESSVRDTVDMSVPESGVFKVESAPQGDQTHLELYEPHNGLPIDEELPETDIVAEPSTPFTASPTVAEEEPSVHQAYAMLKFPDSYYYVKSTNVMITRDEAYRRAYRESKKQQRRRAKMQRAQQTLDDYAREPSHHSQYGGDDDDDDGDLIGRPAHALLSTYSDVGGAVSYGEPGYDPFDPTALIHRGRKSKHNSSSNHSIAPRSLHEFEQGDELTGELYTDREGRSHDPHEWAQVAIHPQDSKDIEKISREHLIIRYDGDKRGWVMDVIGNRVLHNGELCNRGDSNIDLNHDDEIIIISVSFRFMLPADEDPGVMESVEWDDDLETSPAARGLSNAIDEIESDADDSSEDDVPLVQQAQQTKLKKVKVKKTKSKEPKSKPTKLKLKLKNKQASKKAEAETTDLDDKKERQKGKAPAKTGDKTGGKAPTKATKSTPKVEPTPEQPATQTEGEAPQLAVEEQPVPTTEAQLVEFAQNGQTPTQGPPPQASPPAPINLDPNSAFAGADPSQLPQKRKGPGRPPKNGLISKRDDAGVKRKVKEYERQGIPIPAMNELLEMVRVEQRQKDAAAKAASRGEVAPESGMQNIDPRMQNYSVQYTSAPPSQPPQSVSAGTDGPHDIPHAAARSSSPRPRRAARSPSPMPPQETFTEEQLKKPTITYVFIIDEILQDPALDGQADLQTIYDKIQKRWPFYKYGATTNGWQSSVRHNLLQCPRFIESGKSGKGKYWKINFEHELDPKKRKQITPPPQGPSRSGSGGPPYPQPYNTSYAQGGNSYNATYNHGSYPAAGPSSNGQALPNGQQANGQYAQQPHYPNGNRNPSQQPPAAPPQNQPFATIVQAIVAYKPQFLQPHIGKDTHAGAEAQFNQALNHYSELHAGNTPTTEGKIDESQDPFRTMKQIFIQYGQGDTRPTQNGAGTTTAPAPSTTPTANPVPANPSAISNTAPAAVMSAPSTSTPSAASATAPVAQLQPAHPSSNAQASLAAPVINNKTLTPAIHAQQTQPLSATSTAPQRLPNSAPPQTQAQVLRPIAAISAQATSAPPVPGAGPQSRAGPAPMQSQAPANRPTSAVGVQNTAMAQVAGAPRVQAPSAPPQIQAPATAVRPQNTANLQTTPVATNGTALQSRPPPTSLQNGAMPSARVVVKPQPPAAAPFKPSPQLGQQQMDQSALASSTSVVGTPGALRQQQPIQVHNARPAAAPVPQQPTKATALSSSTPQPRAQPAPAQQPSPNAESGNARPQQPVTTTNRAMELAENGKATFPRSSPDQKTAASGTGGVSPAQMPVKAPHAIPAGQQGATPGPVADVRPPLASVKRVADEGGEDQVTKRPKTSPLSQVTDTKFVPHTAASIGLSSVGTKRTADERSDDSEGKRLKLTAEACSTPAPP